VTDELAERRRRARETRPLEFAAMDRAAIAARKAWWADPNRSGHYPDCACGPCSTRLREVGPPPDVDPETGEIR
jgi:hypothetical protein